MRPEIERCLAGRTTSVSISPKREDIIGYLRTRLHEGTTPYAMDGDLEADILKKIPEDISEMYVEATTPEATSCYSLTDTYIDSCWSR